MTELSPAAQAVINAYEESNDCYREEWGQLAAALRAAADHLDYIDSLYEIAAELEAQ